MHRYSMPSITKAGRSNGVPAFAYVVKRSKINQRTNQLSGSGEELAVSRRSWTLTWLP